MALLLAAVITRLAPSARTAMAAAVTRHAPSARMAMTGAAIGATTAPMGRSQPLMSASEHVPNVLFIECGFGCDQHGQTATKAAVRACRNAIEFNSIPSIGKLVPGGYANMKLDVQLGVPASYLTDVDEAAVRAVFPYGQVQIRMEAGGLLADSGIALERMGDKNQDMIICVACVTVGY
jgi:uncharacterized protein (TIGR02058 family)